MRRTIIVSYLLCALTLVVGCSSAPVADDVGQREANEIVAVLRERGLVAYVTRGKGAGARYSVSVKSNEFGEAAAILSRLGLPGERKATFQEMTASSGIIPSSREVEALRLDRALSAQIEDLLRARSDVYMASVVVRNHAVLGQGRPGVSVVVQRYPGASLSEAELKDIVAHSVFGVSKDDVYVSIMEAPGFRSQAVAQQNSGSDDLVPFLVYWRVPAGEYNQLAGLFVGFLVFAAALAALAGYIVGQFNWINRNAVGIGAPGRDSVLSEKARVSQSVLDEEETLE